MATLAMALGGLTALAVPATASTVTSASFGGGAGTVVAGGQLYARNGAALTLSVTASSDTQCVDVSGAFTAHQQSTTPTSHWTFAFTAGAGDGARGVTVAASPNFNKNGCSGNTGSAQASFTLDNTGPVVTATKTPPANAAGWNNAAVGLTWKATDAGAGVASAPTPATDSVATDTAGTTRIAYATDLLGNVGSGSVSVMLDQAAPTVSVTRAPDPNAAGWNNTDVTVGVTCLDGLSGIKTCTGGGSVSLTTEGRNQSVSATAVDNADNSAAGSVTGINIDKTAPALSGAPTTQPNTAGWYSGDVTIRWSASDSLSGLTGSVPPDTTLTGEGQAVVARATVSDVAGNSTTSTSAPVSIDRTPPVTGISGVPTQWTNAGGVTVTLTPTDRLSGVASTIWAVDDGAPGSGTTITLSDEGDHTIVFWSRDKAGNVEAPRTAHVRIDRTAPAIGHSFTPSGYTDGEWANHDVTVTFSCSDSGSGVADCTPPVTVGTEGADQQVTGTATDNAGNTATNTALVSVDKTAPTISAAPDRPANDAGWYDADVQVSFTCADQLSGAVDCPAARTVREGADQSVEGTVHDAAGNSASTSVGGLDVDTTAPVLGADVPTGWHTGDVTVHWTCNDPLSGPASQPGDDVVTGEGDNLSSTAVCADKAGNATTRTLDGIHIDRTPPTTTADVPAPLPSGWYAGPVTVTLTGHDALSGVAVTRYSLDGGAAQTYDGPFTVDAKGLHLLTYWSTDVAGNVEDAGANVLALMIDGTPPTTTVVNPISPASGWYVTSGIPVAFDATDAESGVAATYYAVDGGEVQTYGQPFTADLSTGTHTIAYWSIDIAGNIEVTQTTEVNVDTVPPTITGTAVPGPNDFGWNNGDVAVTFQCDDVGSGVQSGVAGCAGDTTLSNEGAAQSATGTAVDVAGNTSSTTVGPVNIDRTAPVLQGAATSSPNAAGWYHDDVTVRWVGQDGLSGVDPGTQPADTTLTAEGRGLVAGPVTVSDKAGNVSDPATVSGLNIDRHGPVVTGEPTTGPNAAGWYRGDVTVEFSCADPELADGSTGSGVATCPTSKVIRADGAHQGVTSDPATDLAGNVTAGVTVDGINVDGTAPQTSANNSCTKVNGWCTGSTATVVLTATDATSGVKAVHYVVNGGAEQVADAASVTVSVPLNGSGDATVRYWSVDVAGNVEPANTTELAYDNIAPTVTHTVTPAPNASGWSHGDVTVHFTAKDDDAGSGVDPASVTPDVTVSAETPGLTVEGSAADLAGNVGHDSALVRIDRTRPQISGAVVAGVRGDNGWYVGPVTVRFSCSDALSGIPAGACPADVVLTDNGDAQSVTRSVTDAAGNTAGATVSGISIDREAPSVTLGGVSAGAIYTLGAVPAATCSATDQVSGLAAPCAVTVTGGRPNGVGSYTVTATARDRAGNASTVTLTYRVVYRWDGFLQPINDTAHQVGVGTSVFKAGSTVPVKLQLERADGSVVQANDTPLWLTPVRGSATNAPADEAVLTSAADTSGTFRWDPSGRQYIYTWGTPSAGKGYYWRVGVTLDDGQTYFVTIGLR